MAINTRKELIAQITGLLGGRVAEELFLGLPVEINSSISSLVIVSLSINASVIKVTNFLFSFKILVVSL